MRGVIFKAFCDFVEKKFGYETLDGLLLDGSYPNDGGFSFAGNYEPAYLTSMVEYISKYYENSSDKVLRSFGRFAFPYLMRKFKVAYDGMYTPIKANNAYSFLRSLDILHNDEVKKMFPGAEIPNFDVHVIANKHVVVDYYSKRDLSSLAHGFFEGCLKYYGDSATVTCTILKERIKVGEKFCKVYQFEVKS